MLISIAAQTLTRLQPHQIVLYLARPHRVLRVNDCRACVVSLGARTVFRAGREESADADGISPNSEIPIIGWWDATTQTAHFFSGRSEKPLPATPPITETPSPFPIFSPLEQTSFL